MRRRVFGLRHKGDGGAAAEIVCRRDGRAAGLVSQRGLRGIVPHQGQILARQMEIRTIGNRLLCQRCGQGADRPAIQQTAQRGGSGKRARPVEEGDRQAPGNCRGLMQLHLSTWPEVEAYLARSKAILIPIGSTEQHGPNGLLGTDALCPEIIARRAGDEAEFLVGPTFNVGQAQHHMAFPGTITLRPSTMIASMTDWAQSLTRHGFERIYWLNGHGGNIATITAAFSEMY